MTDPLENILAHYGVKGMRWGVTRKSGSAAPSGPTPVVTKITPGKKVKTSGGKLHTPTEDAVAAATLKQKAKSSSTDSLSTKELQVLVTRMNLEQQYNRIGPQPASKKVTGFLASTLLGIGKQQVVRIGSAEATKRIDAAMSKRG